IGDAAANTRSRVSYSSHMHEIGVVGTAIPGNGMIDLTKARIAGPASDGSSVSVIGREAVDGSECIIVEMVARSQDPVQADDIVQFWVDPNKGYVVPRVRWFAEGGRYVPRVMTEETNVQFKQYSDGIWFP